MSGSKLGELIPSTVGAVAGKVSPMQAVDAAKQLVSDFTEWRKVETTEKTNRKLIAAQRDVWIEKIRADREVMLTYLRESFRQQADTLDALFIRLDKALDGGDVDLVAPILGSIVQTVQSSPLGDLKTLDQRMSDGSFTFRLGRAREPKAPDTEG